MAGASEIVLRDVLDIKEDVHAGDFKVELSQGFTGSSAGSVKDYVVTPQLAAEFDKALKLVRGAVRKNTSYAAYLHGSFGAGKSHFLTVLHAVLNNEADDARPRLREVITQHQDWLPGKRFLMVPYHLVGVPNLDSALLGGYVRTVREQRPEASTPLVFKADALLADARSLRESLGDEAFAKLLPVAAPVTGALDSADGADEDELRPIGAVAATAWSTADLDAAFNAPAHDSRRAALVSALTDGPMKAYAHSAQTDGDAYISLDDGLSVISRHAHSLGYDGIVLFLDELILWLQARMRERTFVNDEIQKLVKVIESSNAVRPVPIVTFVSRQRDLSQLVGSDILGADVESLEQALTYLNERFDVINLEDRNLPEIIKERVLQPRAGQRPVLDQAFAGIDRSSQLVKDILLDDGGATHADWDDFRAVYPLSPVLLNVVVALSGALQRERSGLKLIQELLERNAGAPLGQLVPLGDLWDVLADPNRSGAAFTDRLKHEFDAAKRFHAKAYDHLLEKYGRADHPDLVADDRFVKTLLLAALAPDVPALRRLTGARLAALNHGSVRSRTVPVGARVAERLRALQGVFPSELRAEGNDPAFSLHLSDLDVEPLLEVVAGEDKPGVRRVWLRDRLWELLGVKPGQLVDEREVVWRGTKRTVEFVFGNVADSRDLPDEQFTPATPGSVRFVVDYPFDEDHHRYPSYDFQRVEELRKNGHEAHTLIWLADFFSEQRKAQLGRLMRINFLLERNRLLEFTGTYSPEDRAKAQKQLELAQSTLTGSLVGALGEVYGIAEVKEGTVAAEVVDGRHVLSLEPRFPRPQPEGAKTFADNLQHLADGLLSALHPKHPDFGMDRAGQRKAVTPAELRTTLEWLTRAMDEGGRVEVDTHQLATVKRIVEPLELGAVHEGPLVLRADWRTRVNQAAAAQLPREQDREVIAVEDIRGWITKDLGYTGLDKLTGNLLIAAYALLDDRAWVYHNGPETDAPDLAAIGPGWGLKSQPLPSEEEYAAARDRATRLFGVLSKPGPYARNVHQLATGIRAKAEPFETAVAGVRASLESHAVLLGLDGQASVPRLVHLREAAGLLARLSRHGSDATGLVRELAAVSYETSERELSKTMSSSAEVLTALDGTDWRVLASVRELCDRDDSVGDRARRLLEQVAEAAHATEDERNLAPVLKPVRNTGMAILDAALKVERGQPAPAGPGPDQISLTEHGTPQVPSALPTPTAGGGSSLPGTSAATVTGSGPALVRRVVAPEASGLEALLQGELASLQHEIAEFRTANPDAAVEISWRPLPNATDQGQEQQGPTEHGHGGLF
ncbi:hypothetical protein [Streptacidiphilus neutrinimicus]|uniref:hypothetical protein n=1 Tax=Streptacidiphilus neutrinimicus TaxID=105420 RepID=UPI0005AAF1AE|nr:hypothetical protein [Streptacidiphilus neutrinimicus]